MIRCFTLKLNILHFFAVSQIGIFMTNMHTYRLLHAMSALVIPRVSFDPSTIQPQSRRVMLR